MDLVDYSEEVYNKIKADFEALNSKQNVLHSVECFNCDNVVES
jgi:sulfate adenylyltransferase subunit 1